MYDESGRELPSDQQEPALLRGARLQSQRGAIVRAWTSVRSLVLPLVACVLIVLSAAQFQLWLLIAGLACFFLEWRIDEQYNKPTNE